MGEECFSLSELRRNFSRIGTYVLAALASVAKQIDSHGVVPSWQGLSGLVRFGGFEGELVERRGNVGGNSKQFVTIAEASKRLGVSQNTLRSWSANGKIQEYRHPINNYRLYRLDDLKSLAELLQCPVKVSQSRGCDTSGNVSRSIR